VRHLRHSWTLSRFWLCALFRCNFCVRRGLRGEALGEIGRECRTRGAAAGDCVFGRILQCCARRPAFLGEFSRDAQGVGIRCRVFERILQRCARGPVLRKGRDWDSEADNWRSLDGLATGNWQLHSRITHETVNLFHGRTFLLNKRAEAEAEWRMRVALDGGEGRAARTRVRDNRDG
jgi:hypothetical protein